MTLLLYVGLGLGAVVAAAYAVASDPSHGVVGFVLGLLASVALFAVGAMIPTTARTARSLVYVAAGAGVVAAQVLDLAVLGSEALLAGGFGGFMAGAIIGIAAIRRRLAHDDGLLLRQKRLGFDPENPSGWLRG